MLSSQSHNFAIQVEWIVRDVFKCERFGFGGIANADFIEKGMYAAMACSFAVYYMNTSDTNKKLIDDFLNKYYYYGTKSIEEIINETNENEVEVIIEEFQQIVKNLQ